MKAVAELTRAGRLADATAAIQRTLTGRGRDAQASCKPEATRAAPPSNATVSDQAFNAKADTNPVDSAETRPESNRPTADDIIDVIAREVPSHDAYVEAEVDIAVETEAEVEAVPVVDVPTDDVRQAPDAMPKAHLWPLGDGSFTDHVFEHDGTLARNYKLYLPPRTDEAQAHAPMALIVMLHGCTQNPDDFAAGTAMNVAAKHHGYVVLYPEQSRRANPQRCWNWFFKRHQQRDAGEPGMIAALTRYIVQEHNLDARRIYVAGLSAGGAMAAILGQTYPDIYAAIGVHSGLPAGAAADVPTALGAMKRGPTGARVDASPSSPAGPAPLHGAVPTIVIHGDADTVVHPSNGDHVVGSKVKIGLRQVTEPLATPAQRASTRSRWYDADGRLQHEQWRVHGGGHAWFGGHVAGTYTDPKGPNASDAMMQFFMQHKLMRVD